MKILQIFGAVVAVHLLAFILIFASPGCQSGPRVIPTPDATMPAGGAVTAAPVSFNVAAPQPVDLGTAPVGYTPASSAGHAAPTRPGSATAAAITPPKPVADVAPISTYTVQRGDSLWSIAKKHQLTVAELAKANNLPAGAALQPGKKLIIPGKAGAAAAEAPKETAAAPAPAKVASAETTTHIVQPGESLGLIARKFNVTVGEIAAANNLTGPTIRAGQKLVIPGARAVVTKASSTTGANKPAAPAAETPAASSTPAPVTAPHFQIAPPPPDQDLDAGLKSAGTPVPTIKVEDKTTPPKN
jgi:LysM repeat protein